MAMRARAVLSRRHYAQKRHRQSRRPKAFHSPPDLVVRTPPRMVYSQAIVQVRRSVKAHSHADAMLGEKPRPPFVDQRAVGLKAERNRDSALRAPHAPAPVIKPLVPGKKRLAAVKENVRARLAARRAPLPDTLERGVEHFIRHERRPFPPRRIPLVVHVAVRAVQVASRCDLEDELKRGRLPRRDSPLIRPESSHSRRPPRFARKSRAPGALDADDSPRASREPRRAACANRAPRRRTTIPPSPRLPPHPETPHRCTQAHGTRAESPEEAAARAEVASDSAHDGPDRPGDPAP